MIYHPLGHQSAEWFKARIGVATASRFSSIVTPAKFEPSKSMNGYADELVGEMVTGENAETFKSYWMERGAMMEADAAAAYEVITDQQLDRGGFLTNDDMTIGASPDRRVLDGSRVIGAAEIKCPAPDTHIANLERMHKHGTIDPAYVPQVQGQILIGGFDFVDWFSYHPSFPPALIRTYRDDDKCAKLQAALDDLMGAIDDKMAMLKGMGVIIPERPIIAMHRAANDEIPNLMGAA